jgi:hypothetical protein
MANLKVYYYCLFFSKNVKGRAHLADLGVDGRILLKAVLTIGSEVVEWFQ